MAELVAVASGLRLAVPLLYGLVALGYILEFAGNRKVHFFWTRPALAGGLLLHLLLLTALYRIKGHLPYDTVWSGLLFSSLMMSFLYALLEGMLGERSYGAFLFPLNFIINLAACAFLDRGAPLPLPLHSAYFAVHASALFMAYACFFVSCMIAVMYLLQYREIRLRHLGPLFRRLPALDDMDRAVRRMDALGLGLLILGIATGFLWMEMALGSPLRLSAKIALSCLTALVYLASHLLRTGRGWSGRRACLVSMTGFLFVLITLLAGRHGF